jgi:hypothetical protein
VSVFARIYPVHFSYVRTESDTVIRRSAAMNLKGPHCSRRTSTIPEPGTEGMIRNYNDCTAQLLCEQKLSNFKQLY